MCGKTLLRCTSNFFQILLPPLKSKSKIFTVLGGGIDLEDLTIMINIENNYLQNIVVRSIYLISPTHAYLSRYGQHKLETRARPITGKIPLLGIDEWVISGGHSDYKIIEIKPNSKDHLISEVIIGVKFYRASAATREVFIQNNAVVWI